MRSAGLRLLLPAALAVAGCATDFGAPVERDDAIAGSWRASGGHSLSISTFSSFVVQKGCTITGGMLRPVGGGRYRIERYETGFASDNCGLWRSGPEIAPFDGSEVMLVRAGGRLVASGAGTAVTFRSIAPASV